MSLAAGPRPWQWRLTTLNMFGADVRTGDSRRPGPPPNREQADNVAHTTEKQINVIIISSFPINHFASIYQSGANN